MKNALAFALLLTVFGSNAMAAKSGGNGDSYSGPTLSPKAVQMAFDKTVKEADLNKVLSECFVDGKGNGFIEKIHQPIPNFYPKKSVFSYDATQRSINANFTIYNSPNKTTGLDNINKKIGLVSVAMRFDEDYFYIHHYGSTSSQRALKMPNFFELESDQSNILTFDPILGDIVKNEVVLKKLKLRYNQAGPAYLPLINLGTNQKTELMAPAADLMNCITEGIGNL